MLLITRPVDFVGENFPVAVYGMVLECTLGSILKFRAFVPALVNSWIVAWNEVCPSVAASGRRVISFGIEVVTLLK